MAATQTPPPTHAPVRAATGPPLEIPAPPQLIPSKKRSDGWASARSVARLLCTGRLPVVHIGRKVRIADTALLAWLAEQGRFRL